VAPFRGEGERWSLAFNVVAVPRPAGEGAASLPGAGFAVTGGQPPRQAPAAGGPGGNISLSSNRRRPGGFL